MLIRRVVATADASWTATPGIACAAMTADCLPALFCDRAGTRVAAAHAGWRGLAAGVLEATLDQPGRCRRVKCWSGLVRPLAHKPLKSARKYAKSSSINCREAAAAFVPSHNAGKFMADIYTAGAPAPGCTRCHGGVWWRFLHRDRPALLFLPPCARAPVALPPLSGSPARLA